MNLKNFFTCQISFEIQWDPTPKVSEIEADVLYFIWKIKSQPTHTDNFSHEGKKEGKVRLAYVVKTNFWQKIWKWSNRKIEKTGLTEWFGPSFLGLLSTMKGRN